MTCSLCLFIYVCRRARTYLRVSDVTAADAGVSVAMGDDDYVILNGDLSFYAPPPTAVTIEPPGLGVPPAGRCAPWLGVLNPSERAVFVELDGAYKRRYDVISCTVPATAGSRRQNEARQQQCIMLLYIFCFVLTYNDTSNYSKLFFPWRLRTLRDRPKVFLELHTCHSFQRL